MPILGSGLTVRRSSGVTYPLDGVANIAAAYSLRKVRSAYTGYACKVRRSSDNATADIGFTGTGDFDTTAYSAHISGGSGFVDTWYDQSGNSRDAVQSTTTKQPAVTLASVNSRPVLTFDGIDDILKTTAQFAVTSVLYLTAISGASGVPWALNISARYFGRIGNDIYLNDGNSAFSFADSLSTVRIFSGKYGASGAAQMWVNGVSKGTGSSTPPSSAETWIGARNSVGSENSWLNGRIGDLILLDTAIPTGNHNAIGNNMATYYGLSWTTVT